jgi:hypothetical protein
MHEIPLRELKEKLAEYDEMTLLELLDLNSYDLVQLLSDVIEDKYEELLQKLPDEDSD